jgi:hypothetical protein
MTGQVTEYEDRRTTPARSPPLFGKLCLKVFGIALQQANLKDKITSITF